MLGIWLVIGFRQGYCNAGLPNQSCVAPVTAILLGPHPHIRLLPFPHTPGQAKSFRLRMAFLDFCRHTQRHFSCKFVKARWCIGVDHFAEPTASRAPSCLPIPAVPDHPFFLCQLTPSTLLQLVLPPLEQAYLMEPALALAYDRVANVRLHVAAALPALKVAVALPDDVQLLEVLNSGMSHLITDGDADVRQAARKVWVGGDGDWG